MSPEPIRECRVDALEVRVYRSQAEMALAAAAAAAGHLAAVLREQAGASVILASATSQIQFLAALTGDRSICWERVTVFHMDEYLGLAEDHPASFRRFLREHVADRVRPGAVHYVGGDCLEPLKECARYAGLLRAQAVDLCCLGIGENGHLAFNDPPVADFSDPETMKLVRLDDACRRQQVGEGCFPSLQAVPQYAFTLTMPALCSARRILGVVPERRKAEAVRRALRGPVAPACPASWLRRQAQTTLYLDAEAASGLG
ncbi:MAG TPA: glucosamine-6-phosphate deaminase [Verrucomicrobiota bacterium]|nr:glucosamine-6-phosphate deaminase [Verrucomicrobiota bacterium]HNU51457.1 glucosamine-6-phosphate deaminase [Verrucomicrobiota bacterium]